MISMMKLMLFLFTVAALNLTSYIFYFSYNSVSVNNKVFQYKLGVATKNNADLKPELICANNDEDTVQLSTTAPDEYNNEQTFATEGLFTYYFMRTKKKSLKLCPEIPPDLGPIEKDSSMNTLKAFDRIYRDVQIGGSYSPVNCTARQSVAIIIPFRVSKNINNGKHLGTFLYMLHPFLIKQQLDYQVFVVEQANPSQRFNHGMLLNAGFTEVERRLMKEDYFHCIILHEPYIVPLDTRNLYRCGRYPRQLAVSVERPDKSNYESMFGGVFAISTEQFIGINGFSNVYWDNDADYDDLYKRLLNANYYVNRTFPEIGKYKTIKNYDLPTFRKSSVLQTSSPMNLIDGLTTLSYTLNNFELKYVFTHINVTLEEENCTECIVPPI